MISTGGRWLGQFVDLRAECKGDRLTFYIDGNKMASLHDSTYPQGKVGVLSWSFEQTGLVGSIYRFSVQRASWNESDLAGPAPTPGINDLIYSIDFARVVDMAPYWINYDAGIIGVPGTAHMYGGPGSTDSPHTFRYINDYDPGVDVEINADLKDAVVSRGLICRYSEDGWYQAHYETGYLVLARIERDNQGVLSDVVLGSTGLTTGKNINLTLMCAGNQISAYVNGEIALFAEDNTWSSGRYGFMFLGSLPANLNNAFGSYTVRPTSIHSGDELQSIVSDTPQEFATNWGLNLNEDPAIFDPRIKIQDGTVLLIPGDNPLHLSDVNRSENSEMSIDLEFLAESHIILHCRVSSNSSPSFDFLSNGDWGIVADGQILTNGNSSAIHSGQNQFTIRCVGNQLTVIANGETLATVEQPSYVPTTGSVGFDVLEGDSQVKLNSLTHKILQSSSIFPTGTLLNQVSLPIYPPGEVIYEWNIGDFFRFGYNNTDPWSYWYKEQAPIEANEQVVVSGQKAIVYWYYPHDLYDLPLEMSIELTFAAKSGGMGLFCHYTQVGRYEFLIQPDGSWFIRRNSSDWFAPSSSRMTIIAHGTSTAIQAETNQVTISCRGNELILSANGQELGRVQDDYYPEGEVGILFDPYTSGSFTNVTVWRPE